MGLAFNKKHNNYSEGCYSKFCPGEMWKESIVDIHPSISIFVCILGVERRFEEEK